MKKLMFMVLVVIVATFLFVGCIPGITPTPEPEEPAPVMEAVALAELSETNDVVVWSIINVGDVFIREYTLTFEVEYPDIAKDLVTIELTGNYLEVEDMHSGDITLAPYGTNSPESVSVTWELYE